MFERRFSIEASGPGQSNSKSLSRNSFLNAGLPLTSAVSRPATETQGPTAQLQKLVAERESTPERALCKQWFLVGRGGKTQRLDSVSPYQGAESSVTLRQSTARREN